MKHSLYVGTNTVILLLSLTANAADKGGNGGDICENRFKAVRDDIASWIERSGSASLSLPGGVTVAQYNEQMLKYISDPLDVPSHPFKASIQCISEKVLVDGAEKTCRNDRNSETGTASIVCNADRFNKTDEADQYVLVHHEYAGLAGFEENTGVESQYPISNQLSEYLETQVIKKLSIRKHALVTDESCFSFDKDSGVIKQFLCSDTITDVVIPAFIQNVKVSGIGPDAFSNTKITSIVFPASVQEIGYSAFRNNKLTAVELPDGLTSVEAYSFADNQLESIKIPDSVTAIDASAFSNNQISALKLPDGINTIGDEAFSFNQISDLEIPDSVTTLGSDSFANNKLSSLKLSGNLVEIGVGAFKSNQLQSVQIPGKVKRIQEQAFTNNKIVTLELPDSVELIGQMAFYNNQLETLTIPPNFITIDEAAFQCNNLKSVVFRIVGHAPKYIVRQISFMAFLNNQLQKVEIPQGTFVDPHTFDDNVVIVEFNY